MTQQRPSDVIVARAEAFRRADYGTIFDSYHSESMFRQQFADRDDYIRHGWAILGKDFRILRCRVLKEDPDDPEARVIAFMHIEVNGRKYAYVELTWLRREKGAWRCHRAQKIDFDELTCLPEKVDFDTFARIEEKTIF